MNHHPHRPLVLIADDNRPDADFVRLVIDEQGWTDEIDLEFVQDGDLAIERLLDATKPLPDLVLLDLNMPRRSGVEVLQAVRPHHASEILPIVTLTTSAAERDVVDALQAGASAFVVKPFEFEDAIDAIATTIRFWVMHARHVRLAPSA